MNRKIYQVKDLPVFVIGYGEPCAGFIETSDGDYRVEDLIEVDSEVISTTYDSAHATELPVHWHRMKWLDDNNKRQFIKEILFEQSPAFVMADGSLSERVTG